MRTIGVVAFLLAGTVHGASQGSTHTDVVQQLQARWIASSDYTRAVAEQMPGDKYSFRPTPEQMAFAQQLLHIAEQNQLIFHEMLGIAPPDTKQGAAAKADVMARLKETTATGLDVLQKHSARSTDVAVLINGMMLALDHTTHHRGQAIVYLRLNGVTPPEYRR
jgi:uncharacterized damage-inducible protein DinB